MSDVHQYFVEAAKVWQAYWADSISRSTREVLLAGLRKQYFKKK